jgi:hypothetical protein
MNAALTTGSKQIPMMRGKNGNMVSSPFATACPRHPSAAANKARPLVQLAGFFDRPSQNEHQMNEGLTPCSDVL